MTRSDETRQNPGSSANRWQSAIAMNRLSALLSTHQSYTASLSRSTGGGGQDHPPILNDWHRQQHHGSAGDEGSARWRGKAFEGSDLPAWKSLSTVDSADDLSKTSNEKLNAISQKICQGNSLAEEQNGKEPTLVGCEQADLEETSAIMWKPTCLTEISFEVAAGEPKDFKGGELEEQPILGRGTAAPVTSKNLTTQWSLSCLENAGLNKSTTKCFKLDEGVSENVTQKQASTDVAPNEAVVPRYTALRTRPLARRGNVRGKRGGGFLQVSSSGFPGVSWNKRMGAWLAFFYDTQSRRSRTFHPKNFDGDIEAARIAAIEFKKAADRLYLGTQLSLEQQTLCNLQADTTSFLKQTVEASFNELQIHASTSETERQQIRREALTRSEPPSPGFTHSIQSVVVPELPIRSEFSQGPIVSRKRRNEALDSRTQPRSSLISQERESKLLSEIESTTEESAVSTSAGNWHHFSREIPQALEGHVSAALQNPINALTAHMCSSHTREHFPGESSVEAEPGELGCGFAQAQTKETVAVTPQCSSHQATGRPRRSRVGSLEVNALSPTKLDIFHLNSSVGPGLGMSLIGRYSMEEDLRGEGSMENLRAGVRLEALTRTLREDQGSRITPLFRYDSTEVDVRKNPIEEKSILPDLSQADPILRQAVDAFRLSWRISSGELIAPHESYEASDNEDPSSDKNIKAECQYVETADVDQSGVL